MIEPLHIGHIPFLRFQGAAVDLRVYIWRTLSDMRKANGLGKANRAYGLCWQKRGRVFAAIHLVRRELAYETILHEVEHAASQLRRILHLDDDEHDEEINCEIKGLLSQLVIDEVKKVGQPW